jgi:hypothetical protein
MNLYKTRSFARIAAKAGITEATLKKSAEEMSQGLIHADLGGNVFKQRTPLAETGKRGGGRIIVVIGQPKDRYIFVHCYLKKEQDNIEPGEENAFRELGRIFLNLRDKDIQSAAISGLLEEIL